MFGQAHHRSMRVLLTTCLIAALTGLTTVPVAATDRHQQSDDNRYQRINVVSDVPGAARLLDSNLVNAWGLAFGPSTPLWVSNNGSNTSTLYTGTATKAAPVTTVPLVVKIPGGGAPTGVVFNGGSNFVLSTDNKTGPARFIFAGENGEIFGWNATGDATAATRVASTANAVYKGLALLTRNQKQFLLAANFHNNRIDVFDATFARVASKHAFRSVGIPKGYAPFNVAVFGNRVFVSYAKQDSARHDDVAGAGHGFINVFTLNGRFVKRFASRGVLNSPWGMAVAPHGFGAFSGDLLVGNFGNGRIHAFGLHSGRFAGTLRGTHGKPVTIDGLWGLLPGNGTAGLTTDVWFSAGPAGESHGLLGILRATDRNSIGPTGARRQQRRSRWTCAAACLRVASASAIHRGTRLPGTMLIAGVHTDSQTSLLAASLAFQAPVSHYPSPHGIATAAERREHSRLVGDRWCYPVEDR